MKIKIKDLIFVLQKAPKDNEICFYLPNLDEGMVMTVDNITVNLSVDENKFDIAPNETLLIINK